MSKGTLILAFSHGEKELALKVAHDTHYDRWKRLPLPLGEGKNGSAESLGTET